MLRTESNLSIWSGEAVRRGEEEEKSSHVPLARDFSRYPLNSRGDYCTHFDYCDSIAIVETPALQ